MTARAFVPSTLLGAAMSDNTAYPVPALHKKKPRLFIPPGFGVRASRTPLILRYRSLRVARKRASGISERSEPHERATRSQLSELIRGCDNGKSRIPVWHWGGIVSSSEQARPW